MTTATPRPVALPRALVAPAPTVRTARPDEAAALAALSRPFVRSGALRERPAALYAARAADFLVLEAPDGTLDGCVGLRAYPAEAWEDRRHEGVVYNFCVAAHRQGSGAGAALLRAVLDTAHAQSLESLFTATTGGAGLFLRYGFTPTTPRRAPRAWAESLDPRRNARVLVRTW
ncbi:amino acid acetyltransferase [Streptomyces variegatus]|uniref:Amino acid acetyltransferase n=1 Tax=Streptomyces variegatus TaxID=284040 RepID=A0A0M2GTF1_9ACTN|nr:MULTISPECIES: GNAT family N-acetyltransferase [Streptomyces]KJK39406.1 amino acid acetyltransferase [Streptomyces variegatus]